MGASPWQWGAAGNGGVENSRGVGILAAGATWRSETGLDSCQCEDPVTSEETKQRIASSELFAALPETLHEALAGMVRVRNLPAGLVLYRRGDAPEGFYHVASGRVRFVATSPEGREFVLDFAEAGSWFGEIGLFDGGPRVVDAMVDEDSELLVVPRAALLELAHREPAILIQVIRLLSRHIRTAGDLLVDSAFLGLGARLIRRLLILAEAQVPSAPIDATVEVRVAQDELGRLCGGTRESVGRQLGEWQKAGLVELGYGKIRLCDREALARLLARATGELS
ncbi:MAG: CRP/FNR family cyclic AMP-dependent transcriptional regulator [Hyphomicrobiaceae bacterium]